MSLYTTHLSSSAGAEVTGSMIVSGSLSHATYSASGSYVSGSEGTTETSGSTTTTSGSYGYSIHSPTGSYVSGSDGVTEVSGGHIVITGSSPALSIYSGDLTVYSGNAVFNESSGDYDFRVESNNQTHMLFVDASTDRVGIGTTSPGAQVEIAQNAIAASGLPQEFLRLTQTDAGVDMDVGHGPGIFFYVGETSGNDHGGTVAVVREIASDADSAAAMVFHTAVDDTTPAERMRISSTGLVGIGVTDPDTQLEVFRAGTQLKLSYDASDNATFAVADGGDLTINASGGDITLDDNVVVSGNLTVSGTTTTVSSTVTTIVDPLMELNTGASSNSNDLGFVFERGSTGNNACLIWDESADGFAVGTTTATGASTGNISFTAAPFEASTIAGTTITTSAAIELGHASDTTIARASAGQITVEGTAVILAGAVTGITSLLATDIKIGEDDQTKIDFETADEIHFYAANVEQVYLADNIFGPQSDSDVDLGTTGVRWKDAYIDTITTTGAITASGIVTGTGFTAGSAVLAEAELELLDGLTAGTAIASKVVTTDASIDTTGQRNLTISGELDAATLDISGAIDVAGNSVLASVDVTGVATAATFEPDGDTAANDNAAIGYTSVEGLILTGQGSTNDVTIKNDADADVIEIPTGTTNVTIAGTLGTGGLITSGAGVVIADAGNIGSTSDPDAIAIGSDGDVTLTQDLELQHDGATISFGANDEVVLTHVHNDGLLLNADMQLQFRDSAINIRSDADGDLDINADDEIELNSTLVDINANVEISGTATTTGVHTFTAVPVFPNDTVETADIQDNAVTLAKMAGIARGKIIYGDASGDPAVLTAGSNGYVLTSDGTDISWAAGASASSLAADDLSIGDAAVLLTTSSGNITIDAAANDSDIIFKGTDGGNDLTFLTLNGSDAGDATFNNDIILGSDASVIHFGADKEVTLTHVHNVGLTVTHTGIGDNLPVVLQLKSEENVVAANEVIASIEFAAGDSDGTDGATVAAGIHAIAQGAFSATANATKLVFTTGVSESADSSAATQKLVLDSTGNLALPTDGKSINFGADWVNPDVTLTHVADVGLTITNKTSGDNKPCVLQLKSEENVLITNEVIASIEFAAGDSDGTDGATVAAGIHAIAESAFSATANATKLVFTTGVSETAASSATAKMILESGGNLSLPTDGVVLSFGADEEIALTHVHNKGLTLSSSISGMPEFGLLNTNDDAAGGRLFFDKNGANAADNDVLGVIDWLGENDAGSPETIIYGHIECSSMDVSDGNEDGIIRINTMVAGTTTELMSLGNGMVTINGPVGTGEATAAVLEMVTIEQTVVDGDVLGRIEFKAVLEGSGTDAILTGAAIQAEASDTFAADNNETDLVFKTAASEAATEKMRLNSAGVLSFGFSSADATTGMLFKAGNLVTKTANYTATAANSVIVVSQASVTITLPSTSAGTIGRMYTVIAGGNLATAVRTSDSDTINGVDKSGADQPIGAYGSQTYTCIADNAWWITSEFIQPP